MNKLATLNDHYALYVDGSCLENRDVSATTPAAWSVVIVTGDNGLGKGSGEILEETWGSVITDSSDSAFIGAKVGSNNTAELTAIAEALRWLLIEGGNRSAIIHTDSQYAGNLATGNWKAKANKELVAMVQELWREVCALRELKWSHVRAHRGHRWNERADHLANRCVNDQAPMPLSFWKPGQR